MLQENRKVNNMSIYSLKIPDKIRQNYGLMDSERNDEEDNKNEEIKQCAYGILTTFILTLLITVVLYMIRKTAILLIDKQTPSEKNKLFGNFGDNVNPLGDNAHSFISSVPIVFIVGILLLFGIYTIIKMIRIVQILLDKRSDKIVQSNESLFKEIQYELNQPVVLENNRVNRLYKYLDIEQSTTEYLKFTLDSNSFKKADDFNTLDQEAIMFNANSIETITKTNTIELYESIMDMEKEMILSEKEQRIQDAYSKYKIYQDVD